MSNGILPMCAAHVGDFQSARSYGLRIYPPSLESPGHWTQDTFWPITFAA